MTAEMVTIPARRGKAARVSKGQRITIINTHGTQVVDTWAFSAEDPTEWMSMEASRAWFLKLRAAVGDSFVTNRRRPLRRLRPKVRPANPRSRLRRSMAPASVVMR